MVIGDKERFQQVAINLLSNAIDNTFCNQICVRVEYSKEQQQVTTTFVDKGIGINDEDQVTLFNILKNNNNHFEEGYKFGLGLFISKLIVHKYNGKIVFTSSKGMGSSFSFKMDLEDL